MLENSTLLYGIPSAQSPFCILILNPIHIVWSQTLHRIGLCSLRHCPTFSQLGAQKWSSHTLGRLNYATNSAHTVWMCSDASHLRTAACRGATSESVICSSVSRTSRLHVNSEYRITTRTVFWIIDFKLGSFNSLPAAFPESTRME